MADIPVDGNTKVSWVPTIANAAAPTAAELTSGTALEGRLTPDGLKGFKGSVATIDNSKLSSTFNTSVPGRSSFDSTSLMLVKASGTDAVFDLLKDKGTSGFIVIRDGKPASTAFAAADEVLVYPVTSSGFTGYEDREANSLLRYEIAVPVSAEPVLDAVVAA